MERKGSMNKSSKINFWTISKIVIFAIFAIFLVWPFIKLFGQALFKDGQFTLEYFKDFVDLKYYYQTLFRSLLISTVTTILTVIIGVPLAYLYSRFKLYGSKIVNVMIIMSLMSPPFIGAYSWIILLGRNGVITRFLNAIGIGFPSIYGLLGILLVFTLGLYPYIFLYVSGALKNIDSSLEEASESLGASKFKRMMSVTFPVIKPTILAGAIMVFMTSLADFGTPMLIGEGYKVLPVLAYEEFMSETGGNSGMAAALSIIVVVVSLSVLLIQKYVVNRRTYFMSGLRPPAQIELSKGKKILASGILWLVAIISFLPQIVVIYTSFKNTSGPIFVDGFGLDSYRNIFYKMGSNITNTFLFSAISMVLIVIFAVITAYMITKKRGVSSSILDLLVMFPYVIPGAVMGISLLITFNKPPLMIAGTPLIMIIAYTIRKMPYTVRSSSAILQQMDSSVEEAAISLGDSPMKSFLKVTSRIMLPGIISGAILSWISTINELSSSIMLYSGRTSTIAVAIYTEAMRASFGTAAALASILTVATILSFVVFRIISKGKVSVV